MDHEDGSRRDDPALLRGVHARRIRRRMVLSRILPLSNCTDSRRWATLSAFMVLSSSCVRRSRGIARDRQIDPLQIDGHRSIRLVLEAFNCSACANIRAKLGNTRSQRRSGFAKYARKKRIDRQAVPVIAKRFRSGTRELNSGGLECATIMESGGRPWSGVRTPRPARHPGWSGEHASEPRRIPRCAAFSPSRSAAR